MDYMSKQQNLSRQIAERQDSKGQRLFFCQRNSFDTKGLILPSSEVNS